MRRSQFQKLDVAGESIDIALSRDVSSQYDNVKLVADNMPAVVAASENIPSIVDVFEQVVPHITEILLADENAAIASAKGVEATDAALLASKWASNPEDVVVAGGEYSAYHWAQKAMDATTDWASVVNKPDPTITLSGDATGSLTMTDLAGGTLEVVVVDDSHTHDTRYYTETEVQTVLPKIGFDTSNVTPPGTGQLAWNQDEKTLDLGINGVVLQLGQEEVTMVRNGTGSTIPNKTVVMATGSIGNSGRITVAPYDLRDAKYVLGVTTEDIPAGVDGFVTREGKVRGVDTSMWSDGQVLYAAVGGGLTNLEPAVGVKVAIAFVVKAHTSGTLYVRRSNFDENRYMLALNGVIDFGLITNAVG